MTVQKWGASHFCRQARNWSFEAGGRRKEEEGRSQKKCFYKYEMLPKSVCLSAIKLVAGNQRNRTPTDVIFGI
jgi:hypothetical protein